jgi:hypothetical protein
MREPPIPRDPDQGGRVPFADSGSAAMLRLAGKTIAIATLMLLVVSRLPSHSLATSLLVLSTSVVVRGFERSHRRNRADVDRRLAGPGD